MANTQAEENKTEIRQHIADRENPHQVTCEGIGAASVTYVEQELSEVRDATNAAGTLAEENQDIITGHIADKENPHGVTCAKIGAAPAGYGFGEASAASQAWNGITRNGFYRSDVGSPDGEWWYGVSCKYFGDIQAQIAFKRFTDAGSLATMAIRHRPVSGADAWDSWEYMNPLMLPGVEYRTVERWMGKSVYTKLVEGGAAVDEATVELGEQLGIIRAEGAILNSEGVPVYPLPNGQIAWLETAAEVGGITLRCNEAIVQDGKTFCVRIWYVK